MGDVREGWKLLDELFCQSGLDDDIVWLDNRVSELFVGGGEGDTDFEENHR
jgi:hypothetical protein